MPSPITIASFGSRPTACAASSMQQRLGLADRDRGDAGRDLDRGDDAPGAGPEADLDRVDRVAVRGDEPGAGTDAVGGGGDAHVGHLRVDARDDRVGPAGGGDAVDPLLRHALGGEARVDDLEPDVAQLAVQPAGPDGEHAPDLRVALLEVQRGRARRARRPDPARRARRARSGGVT